MPVIRRFHPTPASAALFLLAVILLCTIPSTAQTVAATEEKPKSPKFTEEKIALIEDNLVKDLESPIPGIVIGGTQTVREMKKAVPEHDFSKLIIPLMRIVKDEDADRAERILAALALDEIDSDRGNFAISREAEISTDEVFKSLCANLSKTKEAKKKE